MRVEYGATKKDTAQERIIHNVAVYVRVSTQEQAEDGHRLDAHVTRYKAMAQVKGRREPMIYPDEGVSGTKEPDKRPALAQLLADLEASKIHAVIVAALTIERLR
jgi:site-specific DNA recombinase